MSIEPEHEELHDALGDQVEHLEIAPSPIAEVMKAGTALRARRRMALVSGVATLAVLPVAAVAVFAGSGGGERAGLFGTGRAKPGSSGRPNPAFETRASPGRTAVPTSEPAAGSKSLTPLPSVTTTLPKPSATRADPPSTNDDIRVLADGVFGGQHWRLVRDVFVIAVAEAASTGPGFGNHLPLSRRGQAGTYTCEFTGFQWGDRPAGTTPDLNAGGTCGLDGQPGYPGVVNGPSWSTLAGTNSSIVEMVGQVDATKVATVTITVDDAISSPEPVHTVAGERVGYYVFFEHLVTTKDHPSVTVTGYDAQGRRVGSDGLRWPPSMH